MSKQLHTALASILAMPYYKNDQAQSGGVTHGHEAAVALRVKQAGFTEVDKSKFPKLTKTLLKKWSKTNDSTDLEKVLDTLPKGSYILQPAGSQGFPDLLVKDFSGKYVALECKSGKGTCPMWNDNVPQQEAIYILSSAAVDQTTVFQGKDVITVDQYKIMEKLETEVAALYKKYSTQFVSADQHNRGFIQKSRKQHFQSGGNAKINYFTHPDRKKCEQNVLNYVLKI